MHTLCITSSSSTNDTPWRLMRTLTYRSLIRRWFQSQLQKNIYNRPYFFIFYAPFSRHLIICIITLYYFFYIFLYYILTICFIFFAFIFELYSMHCICCIIFYVLFIYSFHFFIAEKSCRSICCFALSSVWTIWTCQIWAVRSHYSQIKKMTPIYHNNQYFL